MRIRESSASHTANGGHNGHAAHTPLTEGSSAAGGSWLVCDAAAWATLYAHLLQNEVEQAAVMYARASRHSHGVLLDMMRLELLSAQDFLVQCDVHIELTEAAQQRIIKTAWDLRAAIVEFHSHVDPRYPAAFSASDLSGFSEFVPHVWWRLQGQPYAAVVIAPGSLDALVWHEDPRSPELLAGVDLRSTPDSAAPNNAGAILVPTGDTYRRLMAHREGPSTVRRPAIDHPELDGGVANVPLGGRR